MHSYARRPAGSRILVAVLVVMAITALVSACATGESTGIHTAAAPVPSTAPEASDTGSAATKVMVIAEENKTYGEIFGSGDAPYLARLARQYGSARNMQAGYPVDCPSLAAYIMLTSGTDHGICDDDPPSAHPLAGDSIFGQVERSGGEWRLYAESMPSPCAVKDSGHYLVRHAPAVYYLDIRERCRQWQVPLGTTLTGALHDAVVGGTLPAYSFVTPDECNDMHGGNGCPDPGAGGSVAGGDAWLARWMPHILAGPDFRSGRLVVFITWDEGSSSSNHIATLVLSSRTRHVAPTTDWNHCSTLRTAEEILGLALLPCAADAVSMRDAFAL